MKRAIVFVSSLLLCLCMTGCSSSEFMAGSYYNNYEAGQMDGDYKISGSVHVEDSIMVLYFTALEKTSFHLYGELKDISGSDNLQLVYVNSDDVETVVLDEDVSGKRKLTVDTSLRIDEGKGHLEFRGEFLAFKMKLAASNIEWNKFDHLNVTSWTEAKTGDVQAPESGSASDTGDSGDLLNDTLATYTSEEDEYTVLSTEMAEDSNVNVKLIIDVTNQDEESSMTFHGFHLYYRTADGQTIDVIDYEGESFAMGSFRWKDSFEQEVKLPKGTNELRLENKKGKNYKMTLSVKVMQTE